MQSKAPGQPQAQARTPSPTSSSSVATPSPVAKKPAKAVKQPKAVIEEVEEDELDSLWGELQSLSTSLAAQKGGKTRAEASVVAREADVDARHGG